MSSPLSFADANAGWQLEWQREWRQREAEKQSLLNFLLAHVGRRMGAPLHGVVDTQTNNVNSEYGSVVK